MLIKRMKTSTPEGRDRSAMGKGGREGEGIHMHTHTQTKERRGEGHTPHSPFRTRPTTHSLPYSRSESQLLREEKCFKEVQTFRESNDDWIKPIFLESTFKVHHKNTKKSGWFQARL